MKKSRFLSIAFICALLLSVASYAFLLSQSSSNFIGADSLELVQTSANSLNTAGDMIGKIAKAIHQLVAR